MDYTKLEYDEALGGVRCPNCGAILESIEEVGYMTEPTYDTAPFFIHEGWLYCCPECEEEFIAEDEV